MIVKTDSKPVFEKEDVFSLRIECEIASFPDTTTLYKADTGGYISLSAGGGCVVSGGVPLEELTSFLNLLSPKSVFLSEENAKDIKGGFKVTPVTVLERTDIREMPFKGDRLKSDDVYKILKLAFGENIPPFDQFAVNFCRQKNKNNLLYVAVKDTAVAIASTHKNSAYISAVASLKKGMGSIVLNGLLTKLKDKKVYVVCENEIKPFYLKNGFKEYEKAVILDF